jgi:formylglycine-generating enzyme required for sulfatase activity/signal transduction histidine kinase
MIATGEQSRLDLITPALAHRVEFALAKLAHAQGVPRLTTLMQFARLAAARPESPDLRRKIQDAQQAIPLARRDCEAFFTMTAGPGVSFGEVFPETRQTMMLRLDSLQRLQPAGQAQAIESLLSDLEGMRAAVRARRHNLREFLEALAPPLARQCEVGGVCLGVSLPQTGDFATFFDLERLGSAITELVTNALHYAFRKKGSFIRIELKPAGNAGEAVIVVEDDGSGIPGEIRQRLFDRGVSSGGTGEGLHQIRRIVERDHLGRLTVATSEAGTRWEITLPVCVPAERLWEYLPPALRYEPGSARRKKRLVQVVLWGLLAVALVAGLDWAAKEPVSRWWTREPTTSQPPGDSFQAAVSLQPEAKSSNPMAPVPPEPAPPPLPIREMTHAATGIRLVYVPAGEFVMGSDLETAESPPRRVRITRPFWLGKFPVTQREYEKVMGENPSRRKGPDLPVEQVSYVDAAQFCIRAGLRLPTEAEWEYAARGTAAPAEQAEAPRPVGGGVPNPQGFHDMLGNVAEWCADWYGLYDPRDTVDPQGPKRGSRRVVRGGSFLADPAALRATMRGSADSLARNDFIGLRVAMDTAAQPEQGK